MADDRQAFLAGLRRLLRDWGFEDGELDELEVDEELWRAWLGVARQRERARGSPWN